MAKTLLIVVVLALLGGVAWVKRDFLGWPSEDSGPRMSSEQDIDLAAPDAAFREFGDNWVELKQYRGQVVLLNFWATWCPPCQVETPTLIQLQEKYGSQGFTVVAVAMDDEGAETVKPFVETKRFDLKGESRAMNFPVVLGTHDAAEKFGADDAYPTSFLISRDGRLVKRIQGPVFYETVSKAIRGLL